MGRNMVIRLILVLVRCTVQTRGKRSTGARRWGVELRAAGELRAEYHSGLTAVLQIVRMRAVYNMRAG